MIKKSLFLAIAGLGVSMLSGQTYPLSKNFWGNPEFRERVTGSYGAHTDLEPKLSDEDAEFLRGLVVTLEASLEQGAALLDRQIVPASSPVLHYMRATVNLQLNRLPEAIKSYEQAIKGFPNFMRAYKNLGIAYVQSQELEKGVTMLIKGIELGGGDGLSYGLLGYCYLNLELYSSAVNAYGLAIAFDPKSKDWKLGKIRSLVELRAFNEAAGLISELIAADPTNHELYLHQANMALANEDTNGAMANLEIVRRMGKGEEASLFLLGDIYANQGMYALANDVYGSALRKAAKPDDRVANVRRALRAYIDADEWDMARALLGNAMELIGEKIERSQRLELLNLSAEVELGANNSAAAAATLETIVEEDPMNGGALLLLARFAVEKGDFEEAEFLFERAQKIESVSAKAFLQHGQLLVQRREYLDAAELLRRSLDIDYQSNVADFLRSVEEVAGLR